MKSPATTEQRCVFGLSALLATAVILLWLGIALLGQSFANAIVAGEPPFSYLRGNAMRLLGGVPEDQQAETLWNFMRTYVGRLTTVYAFCQGLLLWGSWRNPLLFTNFFSVTSHPINLAIFRICFFAVLLPRVKLSNTLHLVSLPVESRVAPPGLAWMTQTLPAASAFYTALHVAFIASCVLAMIGLWTRYACWAAALLTFYLLGITQLFGKIEHQHHLVWVAALLAAAPCADVLSVDAWREHGSRWLDGQAARAYALPLRCVWLFLGLIYFFPGLWKYVISGPQWFLSDNLRSRMLLQQFIREGWEPLVHMEQFPILCQLGGLTTILLEIGFVLLIFLPRWRYVAAATALSFHFLVRHTLGISFWPIQMFYISFVDWYGIWNWMTGRTTRSTADPSLATEEPNTAPDTASNSATTYPKAVVAVAAIVLVVNTLCGFTLLDSWPFGVYPTFARVIGPSFQSLSFAPVNKDGQEVLEVEAFFDPTVRKHYGVSVGRLGGILEHLTRVDPDRAERLQSLWLKWHQHHPEVHDVANVRFYLVDYSTDPADSRQPIGRHLLETVPLNR